MPVFDAEGHLQASVCTSTDLSDWYRMKSERETIERRYHQGFEDSAVGVAILDLDVRYLRVNPAFCALVGREESELVGHHPDELGVQRDGMSIADQVAELFCNESGSLQVENSFEIDDGSLVWVLVTGTLIRDEGGEPEYLFVQIQDITERKRAELGREVAEETLRATFDDFVAAVAKTAELRDPYTAGHQERVTEFATLIARELGVDAETLEGIRVAATIHDVGKLRIPAEILIRPGRLSAAEFESVKQHPRTGYDIVKDVEFPWPVARVILEHHERMDGSGYPQGLVGDEILLESRIVAVAEVLDAVSSHRPYRPAKGIDAAIEILVAGRGTLYDADVVDACLRVVSDMTV